MTVTMPYSRDETVSIDGNYAILLWWNCVSIDGSYAKITLAKVEADWSVLRKVG